MDKLLGSGSVIGKILAKMDRAAGRTPDINKFKLIVRTGPLPSTTNARTSFGTFVGGISVDTITVRDSVVMRGSELGIARVLSHEIIHAYMGAILQRYFYGQFSVAQINSLSVDSAFDNYFDTLISIHQRLNLRQWEAVHPQFDHNFMANKLLDLMAKALAIVDNNRNSDEYYWQLCWGGLQKSVPWLSFWPNYSTWPPTSGYPAPSNDSTRGLTHAMTEPRLDSIWHHLWNELGDTAKALGRHKIPGGCY